MFLKAFKRLVQRILRVKGFSQVEVTGRTGDAGIKVMASQKLMVFYAFISSFNVEGLKGKLKLKI